MQSSMKALKPVHHGIVILGLLVAILLRFNLIKFESPDYIFFLEPWYDFIVQHGGITALKYPFSLYSPPYLYWIVFASSALSWLPKVVSIKLLSIGFDFICAFFVYQLVKEIFSLG